MKQPLFKITVLLLFAIISWVLTPIAIVIFLLLTVILIIAALIVGLVRLTKGVLKN